MNAHDPVAGEPGESGEIADAVVTIDGMVERPTRFTFEQLANLEAQYQIVDVSRIDASRQGDAVTLAGLLAAVGTEASAEFLGLHSSHDDFHASIPLAEIRDTAFLIYRLRGQPLPRAKGGPARFYIPNHATCHMAEIDECANVKFVDHIELTSQRGFDNRPHDEAEHAKLHERS